MQVDEDVTPAIDSDALAAFRKEIQTHVQKAVDKVIDSLATAPQASQSRFGEFHTSERLLDRVGADLTRALKSNGFQRSVACSHYVVPYQEHLPVDFDPRSMNLVELANCSHIGRKRVPYALVANVLPNWASEFVLPQNKFSPFNCQKISCLYFGTPAHMISGDLARGVAMGHLWNCLSPAAQASTPHSMFSDNSYTPPEMVEFDLIQALLTGRKCATFNKPISLLEALYHDSPDNNLCNPGEERYNMCGALFRCAKQLAEAWNAMISGVHGYPPEGTPCWQEMQPYMYTSEEVKQVMAALSAVVNCNPDQAIEDAELFYPGRMRPHSPKDPRMTDLQRHICYLQTPQDIQRARELLKLQRLQGTAAHDAPMHCVLSEASAVPGANNSLIHNVPTRPAAIEKFNVRSTSEFTTKYWASASDIAIKRSRKGKKK